MSETAPREIRIIGGGLAGLALGVGLRGAGIPVTIHEAGEYPRHRVCGEFIAGLPPGVAAKLGIAGVLEDSLRHHSVRWFSGDRPLGTLALPSAALGLSRFVLDQRLAERFVAAGGYLLTRSRQTNKPVTDGWVFTVGRRRVTPSPWAGLKVHVRGIELTDDLEFHVGSGAYVGQARVEDGWINLCGLFRKRSGLKMDTPAALAATLRASGLSALAQRMEHAELRAGSATAVAGFTFDRRISRSPLVELGDACALIPPFTGNGMAMAFIGAALALAPLIDWAQDRQSWAKTTAQIQHALRQEFRLRLAGAALLHPLLLNRFSLPVLSTALRSRVLPMRSLYRLLH